MSNRERIRRSIARTVMKKAWQIVRSTGKAINEALKLAWLIIKNMIRPHYSKVVGVTFEGRQEVIQRMDSDPYRAYAIRDLNNIYDDNAVAVWAVFLDGTYFKIGFVSKEIAASLRSEFDKGLKMLIIRSEIIGRGYKNLGLAFQYVMYW